MALRGAVENAEMEDPPKDSQALVEDMAGHDGGFDLCGAVDRVAD